MFASSEARCRDYLGELYIEAGQEFMACNGIVAGRAERDVRCQGPGGTVPGGCSAAQRAGNAHNGLATPRTARVWLRLTSKTPHFLLDRLKKNRRAGPG
eukprot:gene24911-biopygen2954